MNIQDVINKALSDNSDIAISEVSDTPVVSNIEITKLATALNFIGTNLEQSVPTPNELLAQAELTQRVQGQEKNAYYGLAVPAIAGVGSHMHARERMARAGMTDRDIAMYDESPSMLGSIARSYGYGGAGALSAGLAAGISAGGDEALGMRRGEALGPYGAVAGMYMGHKATQKHTDRAINRYKTDKRIKRLAEAHNKTASLNDPLDQAAQLGKESLLEKIAEDRINPAKISAGPAEPYSGQIMPNPGAVSSEFVGSSRTPKALIDLKAQKVRDRINSDMKKYVKNVGDGYNMQGHLSKFNK